jgi:hypothetical protein
MSLAGALQDFGVAEIFQLIGQQRKTGVLEIEHEDRVLEVYFYEGSVLRARPRDTRADAALAAFLLRVGGISETDLAEARREQEETLEPLGRVLENEGMLRKSDLEAIARLLSEETLFELFFWDEGHFAFRSEGVERSDGDHVLSAENVLLDALRMRDEWVELRPTLPDFASVLAPSTDIVGFSAKRAELERTSGLSGESLERLFRLVDRRSTLRRIIDLSRLGTFQGARGLAAMLNSAVLQVERSRKAARPAPPPRAAALGPAVGLGAVAGAGLFCLALVALLPGSGLQTYAVPASGLLESRETARRERIETLLEVHRWARGAYPETLSELASSGPPLLAADQLGRYSYRRVGDGYRLENSP